jgi:hypothetical protein
VASGLIYNTVKKVAPNIDTKAAGGLVVLPPSMHESGAQHRWYNVTVPITVPEVVMML